LYSFSIHDASFIIYWYEVRNNVLDKKVGAIINIGHETTNVSVYNKGCIMNTDKSLSILVPPNCIVSVFMMHPLLYTDTLVVSWPILIN